MGIKNLYKSYLLRGTAFLAGGIILLFVLTATYYKDAQASGRYVSTTGTISYISRDRKYMEATYTVSDVKYVCRFHFWTSSMKVGKPVTVYYNPQRPYESMAKPGYGTVLFEAVFTLICFIVGIQSLYSYFKNYYKSGSLKEGKLVTANVLQCGPAGTMFDYQQTYAVTCEWTDESGKSHIYKSGNLTYDPASKIVDNKIEVYVDPKNYDRCRFE